MICRREMFLQMCDWHENVACPAQQSHVHGSAVPIWTVAMVGFAKPNQTTFRALKESTLYRIFN
jgi:hypothetical protein